MSKERLQTPKNKFSSLSNNPLMDIDRNLSTLQSKLSSEKSNNNSYISQNSSLSSQLSQAQNDLVNEQSNLRNAQNDLASKQNNLVTLQTKLNGQQALVSKIHGYLSDYQEDSASTTGMVENDQLVAKLIGELAQLNLE
ncbi:MAG: hypothetical protein LN568_03710 [Rickettsia endosymbiont of Pseudomimeciton antennatum]|nr:hypothetical protein [Rickettsia endosymbiont of Pseudomimeciton antennatum]MCC8397891.1 hypothetical protein [Rickettsia endosymbiont of Labidopullus appendiculatus]